MSVLRLVGLDTETTGFDPSDGHRIIEICILTYEWNVGSLGLVDTYVQRIDPDRNVPAASTAVHGITYADLVGKPKWEDVAPEVKRRLDEAVVAIAHNSAFDELFVGHELLRAGLALPELDFFCTMENARWATPNGKSPRLSELCFALGIEFDPDLAHSAEYDTRKMMEAFFEGHKRGFYNVPALAPSKILKVA